MRVDERTTAEPDHWVQSACVLCSNGCDIGVKDGRIVGVRGRAADHINHGRLGPKGLHGWEANHSPDRLSTPLIRRGGELQPATWDEAMALIVSKSKELLAKDGSGAIGFYTSGQRFLEEYYTLAAMPQALGLVARAPRPPPGLRGAVRRNRQPGARPPEAGPFPPAPPWGLALLRDLHDLWLLTQEVQLCWTVIHQAALALRDEDPKAAYEFCAARTKRRGDWLLGRIKQAAPQALVVAE